MGNYQMKTSEDYKIMLEERLTLEKHKSQIILLENMMFKIKDDFNKKIIEMSKRRAAIEQRVGACNTRLKEIADYFQEEVELINLKENKKNKFSLEIEEQESMGAGQEGGPPGD